MQGTDLSALYIVNKHLAPVMSTATASASSSSATRRNNVLQDSLASRPPPGHHRPSCQRRLRGAGCDIAGVKAASDGIAVNGLPATPQYRRRTADFYCPTAAGR